MKSMKTTSLQVPQPGSEPGPVGSDASLSTCLLLPHTPDWIRRDWAFLREDVTPLSPSDKGKDRWCHLQQAPARASQCPPSPGGLGPEEGRGPSPGLRCPGYRPCTDLGNGTFPSSVWELSHLQSVWVLPILVHLHICLTDPIEHAKRRSSNFILADGVSHKLRRSSFG